ncbi:hypothetical protein ACFHYQ_08640 [Sphaerimonospora cavernae]|uniref:Lipoprotein n=1 Tax=Sphaerimonospora cavernae TaxID=1740611 RepID=A0ABV6U1N4_9ACTN
MAWRTGSALLALVVAVSGCTASQGVSRTATPVASPSGKPALDVPSPRTTSEEEAVIAAYTAYWPASNRAVTLPLEEARQLLSQYETDDQVKGAIAGIKRYQAMHREGWGEVVVHVQKVTVKGDKATLRDCMDASGSGEADSRTQKLIPGTLSSPYLAVEAVLHRGADGRWRLAQKKALGTKCTR